MLKALLVNLVATFVGTRTPAALAASGFETALVAYPESWFLHSGHLAQRYRLRVERGARVEAVGRDLAEIIRRWEPDLIVPQDATAYQVLNFLAMPAARAFVSPELRLRVKRSLGGNRPAALGALRATLQSTLGELGLPAIPSSAVTCVDDVVRFADQEGWPVVLKRENSQNGEGVAICADRAGAVTVLDDWRGAASVMVQKYLDGPVIRHSLSALDGRVLAEVTGIQIHGRRDDPRQAPTVVKLTAIPAVSEMAARLVGHWRLSGFSGLDFLGDPASGNYYLIDHNPRINSLSHLGFLVGRDLRAALHDALSGQVSTPRPELVVPDGHVALFPFEWQRDPRSPYLARCPSDTPWDDPRLMTAILNRFRVARDGDAEAPGGEGHSLFQNKA